MAINKRSLFQGNGWLWYKGGVSYFLLIRLRYLHYGAFPNILIGSTGSMRLAIQYQKLEEFD